MTETVTAIVVLVLLPLFWVGGYHVGKLAGIREVRHLFDEQAEDCEKLKEQVLDMRALCAEATKLLKVFCHSEGGNYCYCPAWDDERKRCELRDVENRAREIGIEVEE